MIRTEPTPILHRARSRLSDGSTVFGVCATTFAFVIAVWPVTLALVTAMLAGAVALAAAIAVVVLAGGLLPQRRPALVKAAAVDILRARPAGRSH